jgi:GNAT superfamily N-acetyltransferase
MTYDLTLVPARPARAMTPARLFTIAPFDADDTASVLAMVRRCSATTLYRRFHGITNGILATEELLHAEGSQSFIARAHDRCVGVATLTPGPDGADIGVLVEDACQRKRVGTALIAALVARARELGVTQLRADLLDENRFLVPVLTRIGPAHTALERGGYHIDIALDEGCAA